MTWEVSFRRFGRPGADTQPSPGSPDQVRSAVSALFPETDWSNPTNGIHTTAPGNIEWRIVADAEPVCLVANVHYGVEVVLQRLIALAKTNGWQVVGIQDDKFLDHLANLKNSYPAWQRWKDRIAASYDEADEDVADGE